MQRLCGFAAAEGCEGQGGEGDGGAGEGVDVAILGVEGEVFLKAVAGDERGEFVARDGLGDAALGVDGGGDAVVGVEENPAVIFNGAHAGHVEVLPGGAGVAVPGVV